MKFKYGDLVVIRREGFFNNARGRVIGWNDFLNGPTSDASLEYEYSVFLEHSSNPIWFYENELYYTNEY